MKAIGVVEALDPKRGFDRFKRGTVGSLTEAIALAAEGL